MRKKTIGDYRNSILEKFNTEIEEGKAKYLLQPTPASIRNACIKRFQEEAISIEDKRAITFFFDLKIDQDVVEVIVNYPDGKLRSVTNFLEKGTKSKRIGIDELVAWLIDFNPRPFSRYVNQNFDENSRNANTGLKYNINRDANTNNVLHNEDELIKEEVKPKNNIQVNTKPKSRRFFKISVTIVITILALLLVIVFSISQNIFHISNDVETMRKISTNELPNYIETNHAVWKGVTYSGATEYFTTSGKHPVTGRDLNLITNEERREIIKEYNIPDVASVKEKKESFSKEKSILNPSFKNIPNTQEIAVFVFGEESQLNIKITAQLKDVVFKNYNTAGSLVFPYAINKNIRDNLLLGNISVLGSKLYSHTDYVCVGEAGYTFRASDINSQIFICDLELTYSVYDTKGIKQKELSKSEGYRGQGFTKQEAKNNSIKQVQ